MIIQFSLEGRGIGLDNYQPATVVPRVLLAVQRFLRPPRLPFRHSGAEMDYKRSST